MQIISNVTLELKVTGSTYIQHTTDIFGNIPDTQFIQEALERLQIQDLNLLHPATIEIESFTIDK